MSVTVKIPTPLRRITQGRDKVSSEGADIKHLIESLEKEHPGIKDRLCDETGSLRHFVNVYVNGEDIRYLNGLSTKLKAGDEVSIVPAVAGGRC
jgi:molybdopterin synthase sulfur carrier subunit